MANLFYIDSRENKTTYYPYDFSSEAEQKLKKSGG